MQPIISSTKSQACDSAFFEAQITCKIAKVCDLVETQLVHSAAKQQQSSYDKHTKENLLLVTLSGYLFLQQESLTLSGIGGGSHH